MSIDPAFRIADTVGLDVYTQVPNQPGAWDRTVGQPNQALELSKKTGKPVMIAELQVDDWGDYETSAADITRLTHQLEGAGIQDLLFWRMDMNLQREQQGDSSLTQAETRLTKEALGDSSGKD